MGVADQELSYLSSFLQAPGCPVFLEHAEERHWLVSMQRPVCPAGSLAWEAWDVGAEGEAKPYDQGHRAQHAVPTWPCQALALSSWASGDWAILRPLTEDVLGKMCLNSIGSGKLPKQRLRPFTSNLEISACFTLVDEAKPQSGRPNSGIADQDLQPSGAQTQGWKGTCGQPLHCFLLFTHGKPRPQERKAFDQGQSRIRCPNRCLHPLFSAQGSATQDPELQ